MRKLTTLFFLLWAVVIHAQQITPDEAAVIASEFLNSSSPQLTTAKRVGVKRAKTKSDASDNLPRPYYVFNGDNNQGFVIVSGDKRAKKILGYSNAGTFDFENLPPALEWMLGQYEKEIAALSVSTTEVRADYTTSDTREAIDPLLTTKWNQGYPYNAQCPEMNGQRCVTGCVATAFAQVMNYHKWPQSGNGSHSYEWNGNTYSIDFSQIEFDWDAMLDEYDSNSSERSKDAVAALMKACGYSVDMAYGVSASGAFTGNIKNAAYNFFDYSNQVCYIKRTDFTSEQWEAIIYGQLSKKMPVIYSGRSDESGGHCFVCDGYDGHDCYHINWGWGGYLDGYFILSELIPGTHNYSNGQNCVINFYPSDKEDIYGTSDGTFLYTETGNGTFALTGVAGSGNKLGGDVVLPDETTINGTKYAVTSMLCSFSDILDFENLTGLDIRLPITSIPAWSFSDVTNLKSIKFPSTLQSIEYAAFYNCSGLTGSLTIPNSVTSIGDFAFFNCSGFTGSLTIPNAVTSIGDAVFSGCSGFTGSLTIPNAVTSIGAGAFRDCSGFTGSLTIPNSVTYIGDGAFSGCSGFTGSLTIPNAITSIEKWAFGHCSGFTGSLTIPNAVTSIGYCAFYDCSGFTGSLTIPNAVIDIGDYAFCKCSGFTGSLTIPNSVTSIGEYAFYGCSGFTGSLTIPSSVTSIGDAAFLISNDLNVKVGSTVPPTIDGQAFSTWFCIGVPTGYGADYRANEGWAVYDNLYEFGDANIDKRLTISDAVAVANNIIGVENNSFNGFIADINFDEQATANDVARIVDAVLTYNPMEKARSQTRTASWTSGVLTADDFRLDSDGKSAVGVHLDSYQEAVALQCDFIVGDDIAIDKIVPDAALAETHTLKMQPLEEGRIRVVVYSLDNKAIRTGNRPLFTIYLHGTSPNATGSLQGEMISVSTPDATDIELGYNGGMNRITTEITGAAQSVPSVVGSNGTLTILNAEGMPIDIYSIDGRKVDSFTATSNAESRRLSTGIFIVKIATTTTKITLK